MARIVVPAVARVVVSTVAVLGLYALWPLDDDALLPLALKVVLVVAVLGAAFGFQVRSIVHSPLPAIRAVEVLAAAVPIFLVTFASTFHAMSARDPEAFSEPLSKVAAFYFAVTTFATVGFGDIAPRTDAARIAVTVQMLVNLVVLGVGVRVVVGAIRVGRDRRDRSL